MVDCDVRDVARVFPTDSAMSTRNASSAAKQHEAQSVELAAQDGREAANRGRRDRRSIPIGANFGQRW